MSKTTLYYIQLTLTFMMLFSINLFCMDIEKTTEQDNLDKTFLDALFNNCSLEEMKNLLDSKATPHAQTSSGSSSLSILIYDKSKHTAIAYEKIELLLKYEFRLNSAVCMGHYNAFHFAAYYHDLESCTLFIEYAQKIDLLFSAAKTLFCIQKIRKNEKKDWFPKPILLLILNNVGPLQLPKKRTDHPSLYHILTQKINASMCVHNTKIPRNIIKDGTNECTQKIKKLLDPKIYNK